MSIPEKRSDFIWSKVARRSTTDSSASSEDEDGESGGPGAGPGPDLPLSSSEEEERGGSDLAGTQSMLESESSSEDEESELSSEDDEDEESELPSEDEESDSSDLLGTTDDVVLLGPGPLSSTNVEGKGSDTESGPVMGAGTHSRFELLGMAPEGGARERASACLYI